MNQYCATKVLIQTIQNSQNNADFFIATTTSSSVMLKSVAQNQMNQGTLENWATVTTGVY
jgi:hypothetical protein